LIVRDLTSSGWMARDENGESIHAICIIIVDLARVKPLAFLLQQRRFPYSQVMPNSFFHHLSLVQHVSVSA